MLLYTLFVGMAGFRKEGPQGRDTRNDGGETRVFFKRLPLLLQPGEVGLFGKKRKHGMYGGKVSGRQIPALIIGEVAGEDSAQCSSPFRSNA